MKFLPRLQPKSLTAKINSGFFLLLAVTLLSAAITIGSILQISNATDQNQHAASTLIQLNNLTSASSKLLLTDDEKHYTAGIKAADAINQHLIKIQDEKTTIAGQYINEFKTALMDYNVSLKNRSEKIELLYSNFDTIRSSANEVTREVNEAIAASTERADELKAQASATQRIFANTSNIVRDSKDMQIYALRYASTKSSNFLKRIVKLETKISTQIKEITANTTVEKIKGLATVVEEKLGTVKESIAKVASAGESFGEHVSPDVIKAQIATNKFAKAAVKLKEETQSENQALWAEANLVTKSQKDIEKNSAQSTALLNKVTELRLAVRDYFIKPSTAGEEKVETIATELEKVIDSFAQISGQTKIQPMKEAVASFKGALSTIFTSFRDKETQIEIMAETSRKVVSGVSDIGLALSNSVTNVSKQAFYAAILFAIASLIVAMFVAWRLSRTVSKPLGSMTKTMIGISKGNLDLKVNNLNRADEIGEMANAIEVFKTTAKDRAVLEEQQSEERQRQVARAENINQLVGQFQSTVTGIMNTVSDRAQEMHGVATTMTSAAQLTSGRAETVSAASMDTSNNVQTVATAAKQMATVVSQIAEQMDEATALSEEAKKSTSETTATVVELTETANNIGDIIGLIQDIAEQTNLLALNATIEAARVGEAGRGFLVVANEVKSLANQTAKATDEISHKINEIQASTTKAASSMNTVNNQISNLTTVSIAIASTVEVQHSNTNEISRNIMEVAESAGVVSKDIVDVTAAAGQTGSAANTVLGASSELTEQAAILNETVTAFLNQVKAA